LRYVNHAEISRAQALRASASRAYGFTMAFTFLSFTPIAAAEPEDEVEDSIGRNGPCCASPSDA
jgi:hypothetical protein